LIAQSSQEPGRRSGCKQCLWVKLILLAFDPRPFIRNFEAAVDRLLVIRKDVQKKTEMLERSVKSAEEEYTQKMVNLNSGFEVRCARCRGLQSVDQPWLCLARLSESPSRQWKVK
jgi:hypothetical protein